MNAPQHANQFDKIRILAALGVIFSHHFNLAGMQGPFWLENRWLNWAFMGGVSVMVFLTISGYLITLSWYRKPRLAPYLWSRFLRIWPGMLGSVLICIFVLGLVFTNLPAKEFLGHDATRQFLLYNLSLFRDYADLPGVFMNQPYKQVMNGVYWTIPMEFMCYLILAALGVAGVMRHKWLATTLAAIYIATFLVFGNYDFTGKIHHWIEYPAYFAAGSLIAVHNEWFMRNGKRLVMVLAPLLLIAYFLTPYQATVRIFLMPLLVVFIGNLPATENWFTRMGDPSYGIYLYGFPLAQSVIAVFPQLNFWFSMGLSMTLAIIAGYLSWNLLESRALRLKALFSNSSLKSAQTAAISQS
ncbi:MAG: acyltransferase [Burkholderiaceae bacterium]|nr:acyltransferase [Burkholderiaceae bacterium]